MATVTVPTSYLEELTNLITSLAKQLEKVIYTFGSSYLTLDKSVKKLADSMAESTTRPTPPSPPPPAQRPPAPKNSRGPKAHRAPKPPAPLFFATVGASGPPPSTRWQTGTKKAKKLSP